MGADFEAPALDDIEAAPLVDAARSDPGGPASSAEPRRSRRALLIGALGGVVAAAAGLARAPVVHAGTDGDVVLDDVNTATGTTEIVSTVLGAGFKATGGGIGVVGLGPSGIAELSNFAMGVYGSASGAGVLGQSADGFGVFGHSDNLDGVYAQGNGASHPDHTPIAGLHGAASAVGVIGSAGALTELPDPIDAHTGVYGISDTGHGVYGASDSGIGVYAANNSSTKAAIVAEGGPGTAIHGHANAGPVPASPGLTGIYGSATDAGVAVAADSASGLALRATSSAGHAVRGRGQLDGVIGESANGQSGVVGYSGSGGSAPAGPAKTGVYGEASQDVDSRGVSGVSTSGQGVRGVATTGIGIHGETDSGVGVRAVATTGAALSVTGRATFNRAGRAWVAANQTFVDVTVPGGLLPTSAAVATLQQVRTGTYVAATRMNYPSAGKMRIYLNQVGSTTLSTPIAWFVFG